MEVGIRSENLRCILFFGTCARGETLWPRFPLLPILLGRNSVTLRSLSGLQGEKNCGTNHSDSCGSLSATTLDFRSQTTLPCPQHPLLSTGSRGPELPQISSANNCLLAAFVRGRSRSRPPFGHGNLFHQPAANTRHVAHSVGSSHAGLSIDSSRQTRPLAPRESTIQLSS